LLLGDHDAAYGLCGLPKVAAKASIPGIEAAIPKSFLLFIGRSANRPPHLGPGPRPAVAWTES
jgi:hypothetical protein